MYVDDISKHRRQIKEEFKKYGYKLCKYLQIDHNELEKIINKHDLSKYGNDEYIYFNQYNYPKDGELPCRNLLNIGVLNHQNHNKHHPEYWVLRNNNENIVLDMDNYSIAEMLLNWKANVFEENFIDWYNENKDTFLFSLNTSKIVDYLIEIFK